MPDDDVVAGGFLDAASQGRAFSHVLGLQKDADPRIFFRQFRQNLPGTVGGSVIDTQQFDVESDREDALDDREQRRLLVINGHYD